MDLGEAYLFMARFLAHATDGTLSDSEWERIVVSFAGHTRSLGYGLAEWQEATTRSHLAYDEILEHEGAAGVVAHFHGCAADVRRNWQEHPEVLEAIHADLLRVVQADGHVHPMEEHFLGKIERQWRARVNAPPRA